ncbi:hypothetical protein EPUS_08747 [Endocarpon pusillum Z07020]|uniref:DUF7580 domain-containing protein n=1 Tax=Endocarpon pusillum (strain Z07020 / HMAS-L-300199) TaxID=1263415 RepID=U1GL61_ENDPU|nr:uncharacterized protein EPUS_08747 [Endocarpon pusillum Z07020]ERF72611.1 hypothetical protein EPUS_08747 [Endocarpon pusillum Z07020]
MASGIEVAGVVLAAIPLVISALETYENLLDPTKAFFKYGAELSRATRQLVNYYTSYEQSIRILLTPIADPQELHDMMENTDSELWKDNEIEQALQDRLGTSYRAYIRTVREIESTMTSIAEHLNITGADKITQEGLEAIIAAHPPEIQHGKAPKFEFRKRVNFTMKRQRIKKSLDDLAKSIDQLDTYLEKADKLEEPYKVNRKSKFALPLHLIQQNAARLYDVLSRTWCSAHSTHSAGLLLEQRLVTKKKRGMASRQRGQSSEKCDSNCFGILLLQTPPTKKWLEVEFRIVEALLTEESSSSTVQVVVSTPPTASFSIPKVTLPYADPSQLQVVTNLCSVLQQSRHPWIGFCVDNNGHLRGAYPAQDRSVAYVENGVGLDEILANRTCSLSKEEVYNLSITLTSSLLQLSHTPWLQQTWHKADIFFLRAKDGSAVAVDVKHPYLACEHKSDKIQIVRHNVFSENDSSKLLALGTMLLEICCGQPIENLRRAEDLGPNNEPSELSNLSAARRWLREQKSKGDISFAFYSAILHCLKCFVDPTADLENREFSRTIEEQILAPLEEEQNILLWGPPSR